MSSIYSLYQMSNVTTELEHTALATVLPTGLIVLSFTLGVACLFFNNITLRFYR